MIPVRMPRRNRCLRSLTLLSILAAWGTYGSSRPLVRFLHLHVDEMFSNTMLGAFSNFSTPTSCIQPPQPQHKLKNLTIPPAQPYTHNSREPRRLVLSNACNCSCDSLNDNSGGSFAITLIAGQIVLRKL